MIMWILKITAVLIVVLVITVYTGNIIFDRTVESEIKNMFAESKKTENEIITEEDLTELPEPVQKWLKNSRIIGKERVATVRLKQEGLFKTGEDASWMPFTAEQYYTTNPPGFIWYTTMKAAPLISVKGRDKYYQGRGNMLIKLMSLIKVADATGPEMDQGTLLRYLNEIMWFPSAALNDYIEWEEVDDRSAKATMSYKGVSASAIFYFDENYDMIDYEADRYADIDGSFSKETWSTPISDYQIFEDKRLPAAGRGVWKLDSGDFNYIKLEIKEIEYNNPSLY
ncbi:MAG: DUF6544 family protein [Bacillota bacterium]